MNERRERPEAEGSPGGGGHKQPTHDAQHRSVDHLQDLAGLSVDQLKAKVREVQEEAQRNWQHFLHLAADLENYKKQAARERQDAVDRTRRQMLSLVLSVMDNLERALAFAETPETTAPAARGGGAEANKLAQSLLDGLRLSRRQILDQLAAVGVRPIDAVGKPFDPHLHEAVGVVPPEASGQPAGTVAREVLPGYLLNEDVLRPAKVTVVADRTSGETQPQGERQAARETR